MAQTRSERDLALRYVKGSFCFAQSLIVETRAILVRRVAHCGVVAIDIEGSHGDFRFQISDWVAE